MNVETPPRNPNSPIDTKTEKPIQPIVGNVSFGPGQFPTLSDVPQFGGGSEHPGLEVNSLRENGMVLARGKAAQAWCTEKNKHKVMDPDLAEAFAEILNEIWSKSWLGNATTGELIEELKARSDLNYRTVGFGPENPPQTTC